MVERLVANEKVEGSTPFARSIFMNDLKDKEKNYYIEKNFKFNNYVESEKFVISVGKIAETESHHPDIVFGWGYAKIKISTHAIKGLAESDFVLAAKIDKIG